MTRPLSTDDFKTISNRIGTWSAKWDFPAERLGHDVICMSVADMEYLACTPVREAVEAAAEHGIYGYTDIFPDFTQAFLRWQELRHNWRVHPEQVIFFPRIVQLVSALVNYGYEQVPSVGVMEPAYDPIVEVIEKSNCPLHHIYLKENTDGWYFDKTELSALMEKVDIFMLCSPHNPTGRVWTEAELKFIGEQALKHRTLVVSDDVHAEFTRQEVTYLPLAKVVPALSEAGLVVTACSPGKTFNMAGLESAAIIVPDEALRGRLEAAKRRIGLHNPNYFAVTATIAGWMSGESWLDSLTKEIDANISYTLERLSESMPEAYCYRPEGTYLMWVNVGKYFNCHDDVAAWADRAKVLLSLGDAFGSRYTDWVRFNVAMPREQLATALDRLFAAL